ncbi:MAG: HEAT repeat domain-containing protein [FCB group bacterium]|nr:HEAT repeat domain-containing protein [FCB group bacterium]
MKALTEQFDVLWPSASPALQIAPGGPASAEGVLRKMGQSEDPETRRRALEGLRVAGDGLEGEELLQALQDPSPTVRASAASSLVNAEPELAFAAAMEVLSAGTPEEVASLEGVLPRLKGSIEKPMLEILMREDESDARRAAAAYSLGRVRCDEALRVLVDLAWSGEQQVSVVSAEALAYMGSPSTLLDLVDLLQHADPDVRYAAVTGLGRIGGPEAVQALMEVVTTAGEERTYVRQAAVTVLARIGGGNAVPVLIRAMAPPNMGVRDAAAAELRRLTGMDLGSEPELWEQWYAEQEVMRQQAAPQEQTENAPPLVPSLPMELPPGVTLDEPEDAE